MKRRIILSFILLLTVVAVYAQNVDVSGKVTDSSGGPLPGVFVQQSGTSNAVSTDDNGRYSISVPPGMVYCQLRAMPSTLRTTPVI